MGAAPFWYMHTSSSRGGSSSAILAYLPTLIVRPSGSTYTTWHSNYVSMIVRVLERSTSLHPQSLDFGTLVQCSRRYCPAVQINLNRHVHSGDRGKDGLGLLKMISKQQGQ